MSSGRENFTLVELVVVLVIMLLLVSLSVSSLRGESGRMILQRCVRDFDAWCAGVRYLCAENGVDYAVTMIPYSQEMTAAPAIEETSGDESGSRICRQWKIPEKCSVMTLDNFEYSQQEQESLELLRFYADGGAGGIGTIVFKVDELSKYLTVSALSGRLIFSDHEPDL